MAGEWIAYDIALPSKPEVQELIDTTDQPVEVVVYRLLQLWGWASMHCADGTARMTLPRLVRTCGGDEAFWRAVAAVGWLEIDETAATVAVPGWDRRFSQAAKSRLQHRERAAAQNEREPDRRQRSAAACAPAQPLPAPPRSRGDRGESPPPPREASQAGDAWQRLREAWNAGATSLSRRRPWKPAAAPDGADAVIHAHGWMDEALEAIPRLADCRYFDTPVTLIQFTRPGFVQKVLGHAYDEKTPPKAAKRPDDAERPSADAAAKAWQRSAADPDRARRQAEYLEAKARKAGRRPAGQDDDFEAARASALAGLREAT